MKIEIEEFKNGFKADFIELSGSPQCGTGKTKEEAVATLFIRQAKNLGRLNMDYLEINGVPFTDICHPDD